MAYQMMAEFAQGPFDAFAGGIFRKVQGFANFTQREALQKTQGNGGAIQGGEFH